MLGTRDCDSCEAESSSPTPEDIERHMSEIKEWDKAGHSRNNKHIKQLLKATVAAAIILVLYSL